MNAKVIILFQKFFRIENDPIFKNIFRGSFIVLIARVLNAILLLGINLIVARLFTSETVGTLALMNSILTVLSVFSNLGTPNSVLRLVPEYFQKFGNGAVRTVINQTTFMVITVSPIISFVFIVGLFIWKCFYPHTEINTLVLVITSAFLPFFSLSKLFTELIRALQKTRLYAFAHLLPALSNLVILFFIINFRPTTDAPIIAYFISGILVFIVTFSFVLKNNPAETEINSENNKPSLQEIAGISIPMGISSGLYILFQNFDVLALGFLRTETEIGIYSIATKLSILTGFILFSVNAVSAPHFSELYYSNKISELISLSIKSSRMIFWTSFPILALLIIGGKLLLSFFGPEFITGYPVLVILVIKEFINAAGGSVGQYLNMTGSHIAMRNIFALATVINISLNLILIPLIGIIGAAIASLVCFFFWNGTATILIYKKTGKCISYIPGFIRRWANI